jgi:hypothetical protein
MCWYSSKSNLTSFIRPWPRHGEEVQVGDIQSVQLLYRAAVDSEIAHGHSVRWADGPGMSMMIASREFAI